MLWNKESITGHWRSEFEGKAVKLVKGKWGNSSETAWEIFIDGKSHGKELTLAQAKNEARRCMGALVGRNNF